MSESEMTDDVTITQLALRELEEELKCSVCLEVSANLCSLGVCEHLVCRQCLDKGISRNCPTCRLPFDAKDVKDHPLVCNLVDLCKQLREIIFNPTAVSSDDDNTKTREDTIYSLSSKSTSNKTEVTIYSLSSKSTSNKTEVTKPISIKSSETSALSLFAHELDKQSQEAIFNQTPESLPPKKLRSLERKNISKIAKSSVLPNKKPCITKYKSKSSFKHLNLLNASDSSLRFSFSRFSNKGRKRSAPALVNLASPEPKWKSPQAKKSRSPAIMKKNAKGETPLHVAVIKNNLAKVQVLLTEGADVNTKDHAGWTPLHEACNHGYEKIAKVLLDNGALINTPGSENDTALHDAVRNGRIGCVKLLVSHGACQTLRNAHGLMAKDYAFTDAMKEALTIDVLVTSSTPELQSSTYTDGEPICILATALSRDLKVELRKLASVINAKIVDDVSPEVTHVVIGVNKDGLCPRTLKYLKAILAGKWIVSLDWLRTCVEYGYQVSEEPFEVAGSTSNPFSFAPFKGRMNKLKQLPRLFDGCQFYFHGAFNSPVPTKEELMDLVKQGSGYVLSREPRLHTLDELNLTVPYHAVNCDNNISQCGLFIVYAEKTHDLTFHQHPKLCTVSVSCLMESIATFFLSKLYGIMP